MEEVRLRSFENFFPVERLENVRVAEVMERWRVSFRLKENSERVSCWEGDDEERL